MLRFKRQTNPRISNRLAVFAGLLLVVSALAGTGGSAFDNTENDGAWANNQAPAETQSVITGPEQSHARKRKGFKVSLFLFRLN